RGEYGAATAAGIQRAGAAGANRREARRIRQCSVFVRDLPGSGGGKVSSDRSGGGIPAGELQRKGGRRAGANRRGGDFGKFFLDAGNTAPTGARLHDRRTTGGSGSCRRLELRTLATEIWRGSTRDRQDAARERRAA